MPAWTPAPPLSGDERGVSLKDVIFEIASDPVRQSRWSVLFRIFLSIPLLIWAAILTVAAEFVVFVSWFVALFTGRVPDGNQRFLTNVVRYVAEVTAYASVLVPRWPGFSLHPGDKAQVNVRIEHVRLNRAAVFFRILLSVPAVIVSYLVSYGGYLLSIVVWISALILGRPARPLYGARALSLRFSTRFVAYVFLLTPTQPFSGFFGDHAVATTAPVTDGIEAPVAVAPKMSSRLILSTSARVLFILSLVLGGVVGVAYQRTLLNFNKLIVLPVVNGTQTRVVNDLTVFKSTVTTCVAQSSVPCVDGAANSARSSISGEVAALNVVSGLASRERVQFNNYIAGLNKIDADMVSLTLSTDLTQQESFILDTLNPDILAVGSEYTQLRARL